MDMTKATGPGGLPNITGITASNGASISGKPKSDGDRASVIHGLVMTFVFLVMYALNVIIIELFKLEFIGMFLSILFLLLMLGGFGLGVYVSTEYIKVRPLLLNFRA